MRGAEREPAKEIICRTVRTKANRGARPVWLSGPDPSRETNDVDVTSRSQYANAPPSTEEEGATRLLQESSQAPRQEVLARGPSLAGITAAEQGSAFGSIPSFRLDRFSSKNPQLIPKSSLSESETCKICSFKITLASMWWNFNKRFRPGVPVTCGRSQAELARGELA